MNIAGVVMSWRICRMTQHGLSGKPIRYDALCWKLSLPGARSAKDLPGSFVEELRNCDHSFCQSGERRHSRDFSLDMRTASGNAGFTVEPGHQFEWVWMLMRCRGKNIGRYHSAALHLIEYAELLNP